MPESRKRKKRVYATPARTGPKKRGPSPVWLAPLMLTLFLLGIVWLVVFYVTQGAMPLGLPAGNTNLIIGFGLIVAGFGLSTQWR